MGGCFQGLRPQSLKLPQMDSEYQQHGTHSYNACSGSECLLFSRVFLYSAFFFLDSLCSGY